MSPIWSEAKGLEFDLLRSLPPERQSDHWWTACRTTMRESFGRLRFWVLVGMLFGLGLSLALIVQVMVILLGIGWLGAVLIEAALLHRPCLYITRIVIVWLVRPYLRDELLLFADSEWANRSAPIELDPKAQGETASPST